MIILSYFILTVEEIKFKQYEPGIFISKLGFSVSVSQNRDGTFCINNYTEDVIPIAKFNKILENVDFDGKIQIIIAIIKK